MIKVLLVSNFSKALTGFGKNMRNILLSLHDDDRFEVVEAANGAVFGRDLKTPWKSYGTYPNDPSILQKIQNDPRQKRLAEYGSFTIDTIVELEKPDIVVGIEDVWAFDWSNRIWFDNIPIVIWTTLDSLPILDLAYQLETKVEEFLVWSTFAKQEMRRKGCEKVDVLHGAINLKDFFPIYNRHQLRANQGINEDDFIIGYVCKNQLRKSIPNLLEGFKKFKKDHDKAKLLLHTDWATDGHTWNIPKLIKDIGVDPKDVLTTYVCSKCGEYTIKTFDENNNCPECKSEKSLKTKDNMFGVNNVQLNEIYNIMDVYCHPFTSGGQELPLQEAKAAGLITLVTSYSCGLDSCFKHQGGLPLRWTSYYEPSTQFIKATTSSDSICEQLEAVFSMSEEQKRVLIDNGLNYIDKNYSVDTISDKFKTILLKYGKNDWDYNFTVPLPNPAFTDNNEDDAKWLISIYKGMFDKNMKPDHVEIKEGLALLKQDGRGSVYSYLQHAAIKKLSDIQSQVPFEDILDKEKKDRIAVVMPESAGDILIINSLMKNLKSLYPQKDIYFFTNPQYFSMIDDNPYIYKLLPYNPSIDNLLFLEGRGDHMGHFEVAFLPHILTQKNLGYLHNGADKNQFNL